MSLDNQATLNVPSMQDEKPKSGALKWILGGCGCLGLLAAICVGGFVFYFGALMQDTISIMNETVALAENSAVVKEALGEPVEITGGPRQSQNGKDMTFEVDVTGPNGSGTVYSKATVAPSGRRLESTEMYLEFDGQRFDLNTEDEFNLDVEGLDE
jgi:hypothetical protein